MKKLPDVDKDQMTRDDMRLVGKSPEEKEQLNNDRISKQIGCELLIKRATRAANGNLEILPASGEDKQAIRNYCETEKIPCFQNEDGFLEMKG